MRMIIGSIVLFFSFLFSLPAVGQRTKLLFNIKNNTVSNGERYENLITVNLAPKDQIQYYEVYLQAAMKVAVEGCIARISFTGIFMGDQTNALDTLREKSYRLQVRLRTLQLDTLIDTNVTYFIKPDPATFYKLRDESLKDAVVYPEVMPVVHDEKNRPFRTVLASNLLKGQKGMLVFSFVIDTDGKAGRIKMVKNTFKALTIEKLATFIQQTQWTPGKHNGKIVRTVYGVHIVR